MTVEVAAKAAARAAVAMATAVATAATEGEMCGSGVAFRRTLAEGWW